MSTTALSPRQGPIAAHVVQLLQTAYPKHWEKHIRNFLGDIAPADLPPAELAQFTDHVFWLVKQTGLREPAAWLAHHRAQEANMAPVAPVQLETPVEIAGDLPVQRDSVELEPVKLRGSGEDLRRVATDIGDSNRYEQDDQSRTAEPRRCGNEGNQGT